MNAKAPLKIEILRFIPPDEVIEEWPRIKHWIAEANAYTHGRFLANDHLIKLLAGQMELWVSSELAMVCEIQQYPRRRVYQIVLVGGNSGYDWSVVEQQLEAAAKARGCDSIEAYGRPGWRKILGDAGYSVAQYVYYKDIRS